MHVELKGGSGGDLPLLWLPRDNERRNKARLFLLCRMLDISHGKYSTNFDAHRVKGGGAGGGTYPSYGFYTLSGEGMRLDYSSFSGC